MANVVTGKYPLYVTSVKRWGNSYVMVLPLWIRERLCALDGAMIAMRVHEPYVTFRVWPPPPIVDPSTLDPEKLPPSSAEALRRG